MNAMERMKLLGELARIRKDLQGGKGAMERLKLLGRVNQIRKQLGVGAKNEDQRPSPDSEKPNPSPDSGELGSGAGEGAAGAVEEGGALAFLQAVAQGKHDSEDLAALFGKIEAAMVGLNDSGLLTDDAEMTANHAITRFVELGWQFYGD